MNRRFVNCLMYLTTPLRGERIQHEAEWNNRHYYYQGNSLIADRKGAEFIHVPHHSSIKRAGSSSWFCNFCHLRLSAFRAYTMTELCLGMITDILYQLIPDIPIVSDFMTIHADGDNPLQLFYLSQSRLKFSDELLVGVLNILTPRYFFLQFQVQFLKLFASLQKEAPLLTESQMVYNP